MRSFNKKLNVTAIEEGAWTPTLQDTSLSDGEGQTYSVQIGHYTRIGSRVFIFGKMTMTSIGTLAIGDQPVIAGLPFTSSSEANSDGGVHITEGTNLALDAALQTLEGVVSPGLDYIKLVKWDGTSGTNVAQVNDITGFGSITFNGHFLI